MTFSTWRRLPLAAMASLALSGAGSPAHAETPVAAWEFSSGYDLPRRAAAHLAETPAPEVRIVPRPADFALAGMSPSERRTLLDARLGTGPMAVELWVLDHVNTQVGAMLAPGGEQPAWALAYVSGQAAFGPIRTDGLPVVRASSENGYKQYWRHLVGVYDGEAWRLYVNGREVASAKGQAPAPGEGLGLTGYLEAERFMRLPDLVKAASLYDRALTAQEVADLFARRARLVDEGRLTDARLHFTQPPYLNWPTSSSMALSWETDRPTSATVEWGEAADALTSRTIPLTSARQHGITLEGLKADTPYFYRVRVSDARGATADSSLLSFRTAPPPGAPFTIAVSGDPEARPHVNNQISQLIWEERPNLLLIAGDLTDGGSEDMRFQWTHEYFTGMGPLFGRVPVIAAPGNGEDDMVWYRRYHRNPEPENYFSLRYGDAEIFVLDSNLAYREAREPGFRARQKAWLERALAASTAKWKFTIHHHDVQTSDDDDYGDSWKSRSSQGNAEVQADFRPLYEKYGVDVAFFAHLHTYERSWPLKAGQPDPDGVTYVQVGGLGGNLEDFQPTKPAFSRKTFRDHHYLMLRGMGDELSVEVFDSEGRMRDRFELHARSPGRAR